MFTFCSFKVFKNTYITNLQVRYKPNDSISNNYTMEVIKIQFIPFSLNVS